jgi:tRNA nucleotidyltransferase (CCA-adding enzyme)
MKTYLVGGAVRDELLGRPVKDRDWVVVGATAQEMLDLGYTQVGADFPVFLHPQTKEEYALARQERKVGPGYHGFETRFDPTVTLEDDLVRRDLTINAMAKDEATGELIDPHGGAADLKAGVLRHVSPAFAEDPVRVLRVARFAARYGYTVAEETKELMSQLVAAGELEHLTAERVWAELEKAMGEANPTQFFHTLQACGALAVLFPELGRTHIHTGQYMSTLSLREAPVEHRFMVAFCRAPKATEMLQRLKAPVEVQRLVGKFATVLEFVEQRGVPTAERMLELFTTVDALRRPTDLVQVGQAMLATEGTALNMNRVLEAHRVAQAVTFATVFPNGTELKGAEVGAALAAARLAALR